MTLSFKSSIFLAMTLCLSLMIGQALAKNVSQDSLIKLMEMPVKPILVDVRTVEEFNNGHISGAINIPHHLLKERLTELKNYKKHQIILYCRSGRRVGIAEKILIKNNFKSIDHLTGDFNAWQANNMPEVK